MLKQNLHKTGIRGKIILIICLSTSIIMALGICLIYLFELNLFRDTLGKEYTQISQLLGKLVSHELDKAVTDVEVNASRLLWIEVVKESNLKYGQMDAKDIQRYLLDMDKKWINLSEDDPLVKSYLSSRVSSSMRDIREIRGDTSEIFITDKFGGLVAASNKTSDFYQADEEWWQRAFDGGRGKVFVGDVEFDESSKTWVIPIAVPIRDKDFNVIGVCKECISIKVFFGNLENFAIGKTGHAVLVNQDGYILFHYGMVPMTTKFFGKKDFRQMLSGKKSYLTTDGLHAHAKTMFTAFTQVNSPFLAEKGIIWTLFIDQEAGEVFAPLNKFIFQLIMISLLLVIVMIPLSFFVGGIFVKPIKALHEATEKVIGGDWNHNIQVNTNDEIEQFADTFREMISVVKDRQGKLEKVKEELEELSRDLEKRVEERTKDLAQAQEATLNILEDVFEAKKQLEIALRIKSEFTSTVSHELRTPLAAIKESIAIVFDGSAGAITDEQKEFLDVAKRNVDRLSRLINDILDFQKLESGKAGFNIQDNDINEVIRDVRNTMLPLVEKKNLDFTLKLEENLPVVKFDRDKITQVLTNLVSNAIKCTERGSIIIITNRGENFIKVSVKDTGSGIKQEDMSRLFRQFVQLEAGCDRKTGGTGLGLAISKEIIFSHKGKIWAESPPASEAGSPAGEAGEFGKGTAFHFILPIRERRV